ncbi:HEPN domain-containing protein [Parablautia sp. Marseille-Q6255]|uniref:HEPN domain-containing protein n=1 Tax=Parablautia sp. Marseille-Q6255 TaxID=3039593 RepID=UPI0024BBEC94|nr:HEPN domain-containing protein [Parablautia sp. Marseille-Q6255]
MNQEIKKWVDMAEMDYGVAKHLYETYYPKPYEIICYHCQQSAEKIMKGIIIASGSRGGMPKSHDLSFLMNQIKNQVSVRDELYDYADELTPYGVAVRYPSELFLEEHHVRDALKMADEIIKWGKSVLAS